MAAVTATFSQPRHRAARCRHPDRAGPDGLDRPVAAAPAPCRTPGRIGIIETSSGELDVVRDEIRKMRDLTDKPFGVNIAQAFVRDPVDRRVRGRAGREVRDHVGREPHEVHRRRSRRPASPSSTWCRPCAGALEGGRRRRRRAHRRGRRGRRLQEPAAGVDDGAAPARASPRSTCRSSRPAASSTARRWPPPSRSAPRACRWAPAWCPPAESPVHDNWKQAIVDAAETDTVFLNQHTSPALRALRTERTNALEFDTETQRDGRVRQRHGPLLRWRHGGGHRPVRPGRRAASTRSGRSPRSSTSAPPTASQVAGRPRPALPESAQLTSSWGLPW